MNVSNTSFRLSLRAGVPLFILSGLLLVGAAPHSRPEPAPQPAPVDDPGSATAPPSTTDRPTPQAPPVVEADDDATEQADAEAPGDDLDGADDDLLSPPDNPTVHEDPREYVPKVSASVPPVAVASRRPRNPDELFPGVKIEEKLVTDFLDLIVELTGKHVVPKAITIASTKISVQSPRTMTANELLDLLYEAFRINGVGVIETEDMVILDSTTNLQDYHPLTLGPDDDVMAMVDDGNFYEKVFKVHNTKVENLTDILDSAMAQYATYQIDSNSNQFVVFHADVGFLKRIQSIMNAIDTPPRVEVKRETFRITYADATAIADNLRDIYEGSGSTSRQSNPRAANPRGGRTPNPGQPSNTEQTVGVSEQLRITVLPAINTITVSAEPQILDGIRLQIKEWDVPRPEGVTKIYQLKYADPLVVRDALQSIIGAGTSGGSRSGNRAGGSNRAPTGVPGADGGAAVAVENTYRVEAVGDKRQLIVISKTPENLDWLDALVAAIDQPTPIVKPILVPLKYAQAVEISEQLNALLAPPTADASITAPENGLRFSADASASDPSTPDSGASRNNSSSTSGGRSNAGTINFPWLASGRAGDSEISPQSEIIGKVRIVPIVRQNALSVLAAPEYQDAVVSMIQSMDKPGRQVLIAATIAQVELSDDFAWGIRVSSGDITPAQNDNFVSGSFGNENTQNDFISLFDTSVLTANFNINASLQALDQKTDVKILQQPKIFTADNQEAVFFQGQRIPFITDSSTTDVGGITQSFDYLDVGVTLNVRPRITVERDVSLDVFFELSNTVPGQTLFGGQIIDKRQTETHAVIKNGQTIVLSGIRIESESNIDRRVPFFGDIPIIGALFTSTDKSKEVNELLIFITPIVVDNPEENDTNFNEYERSKLEQVSKPLSTIQERRKKGVEAITPPEIKNVTKLRDDNGVVTDQPTPPPDENAGPDM